MTLINALKFLVFFAVVSVPQFASGWIICPSSGLRVCTASDTPYVISSTTLIQNCVFTGCPPIDLINGTLTLNNVTFDSNVMDGDNGGGALKMAGDISTGLVITNCLFVNCTSSYRGDGGGAIFINGPFSRQINITDTQFRNNFGTFLGGAIYGTTSLSIVFRRVSFVGNMARYGGAVFVDTSIQLVIYNCISQDNFAVRYGGFIYVESDVTVDMNGHTSSRDTATEYVGFFFADTDNTVSMTNVNVFDCYSENAAVFYSWGPANIVFTNMIIQRSILSQNYYQTGHIFAQGISAITLNNVSVLDSMNSEIVLAWNSPVTWNGGTVRNYTGLSCVLKTFCDPSVVTWGIMKNLLIIDSTFSGYGAIELDDALNVVNNIEMRNITLTQGGCLIKFQTGGYIYNISANQITLQDSYILGIYFSSSMDIGTNVKIRNVQMSDQSSIFRFEGTGNINITSSDLLVRNYSNFDGVTTPLFLSTISDNSIFIGISNLKSNPIDPGNINVTSPIFAGSILSTAFYTDYFPPGFKFVSSIPSSLRIVNQGDFANMQVLVQSPIPSILVKSINYFGDDVGFQSLTDFVIMEMREVYQNANLSGETIKAVLDPSTNEVDFGDLDIVGRSPGKYVFSPRGIYDTLVLVPGKEDIWPNVTIYVKDCSSTQRFSAITESCLPANSVSSQIRIALAAVSIIVVGVLFYSLYALFIYRNFNVVKANSYVFLSTTIIGSIISILSIIVQVTPTAVGCMASSWLENTGFAISLSSIIIKMFRLQKIFNKKLQSVKLDDLKDSIMAGYIGRFIVLLWVYLTLWSVLQPSALFTSLNASGNSIYVDLCTSSVFDFIAITVRFMVTLIAAYYSYLIRNVPSNFNETKLIGFSCYNWLVFGTLLSLIVQGYVQDPSTAFIIESISIIFPNLTAAIFLVFIRVYTCRFHPDQVTNAPKKKLTTDSITNSSSAKVQVANISHNLGQDNSMIRSSEQDHQDSMKSVK